MRAPRGDPGTRPTPPAHSSAWDCRSPNVKVRSSKSSATRSRSLVARRRSTSVSVRMEWSFGFVSTGPTTGGLYPESEIAAAGRIHCPVRSPERNSSHTESVQRRKETGDEGCQRRRRCARSVGGRVVGDQPLVPDAGHPGDGPDHGVARGRSPGSSAGHRRGRGRRAGSHLRAGGRADRAGGVLPRRWDVRRQHRAHGQRRPRDRARDRCGRRVGGVPARAREPLPRRAGRL